MVARRLDEIFSLVRAVLVGQPGPNPDTSLRRRMTLMCRLGDEEVAGELLELRADGMRILFKTFVEMNETVQVWLPDPPGCQRLVCHASWVRPCRPNYEVELEYADSDANLARCWLQLASHQLDCEPKGRSIPANLSVQVADSHNLSLGRGICVNISMVGCLLQMERPVAPEEMVQLGLGPNGREASIFLSGRVLHHVPSSEFGSFLHHVRFLPGENRNHSRLRNLMLTLLKELDRDALTSQHRGTQLPSGHGRLSPAPAPPSAPAEPLLSDLIGRRLPLNTRNYELRSTSLWAARNLPVGRRRAQPQDSHRFHEPGSQDPDHSPLDRDYLS